MKRYCCLALTLSLSLTGCASSVVTRSYPANPDTAAALNKETNGIIYFLPMRLADLTVLREPVPADLDAQLAKAEAALTTAMEESTAKTAAADEQEQIRQLVEADPDADEVARNKARTAAALARAALAKAAAAEQRARADRDRLQRLKASLPADAANHVLYDVKLELQPVRGDPNQVYVAKLNHWETRDDKLTIGTTPEGLLTTAELTVVDRTGDILIEIAKAVAAFVGVPIPAPPLPEALPPEDRRLRLPACAHEKTLKLHLVFDPVDRDEVTRVNERLLQCLVPYRLDVKRIGIDANPEGYDHESGNLIVSGSGEVSGELAGLVYRRPLPYAIVIERTYDNQPTTLAEPARQSWKLSSSTDQNEAIPPGSRTAAFAALTSNLRYEPEQAVMAMLPNRGPLGLLPYEASAFVTTEYKVELSDGMPVKWVADRPAALYAVFRIPVALAKEIVRIPAELIKLRFDVTSNQAELVKAQRDLLCAIRALEAAERGDEEGLCDTIE